MTFLFHLSTFLLPSNALIHGGFSWDERRQARPSLEQTCFLCATSQSWVPPTYIELREMEIKNNCKQFIAKWVVSEAINKQINNQTEAHGSYKSQIPSRREWKVMFLLLSDLTHFYVHFFYVKPYYCKANHAADTYAVYIHEIYRPAFLFLWFSLYIRHFEKYFKWFCRLKWGYILCHMLITCALSRDR
jgi:hypothetical protein